MPCSAVRCAARGFCNPGVRRVRRGEDRGQTLRHIGPAGRVRRMADGLEFDHAERFIVLAVVVSFQLFQRLVERHFRR